MFGHRADFGTELHEIAMKPRAMRSKDLKNHDLFDQFDADFGIQNKLNACSGLHKASFYGLGDPIIVVRVKDGRNPRKKREIAFLS